MEQIVKYIPTKELSHDEWLEERRKGLGGSDVAAACGIGRYKTALDVYNDKIGLSEKISNEAMEWGNILEPVVADKWQDVTGRKVLRDNKIRVHKEIPYLYANIDRIITSGQGFDLSLPETVGILEVKTAGIFAYKYWEYEPPIEYVMQIQHYFDVTGYTWGEFAVLIGGQEFKRYFVTRDDELIKMKNERLINFWENHVLKQIPPPPANYSDLMALYSQAEKGKVIQADDNMLHYYERLKDCKDAKKQLEKEEEEIKNYFLKEMKDAEILMKDNNKLLTLKTQETVRLDTVKIKEEMPELYDKYPAKSISRVLKIN